MIIIYYQWFIDNSEVCYGVKMAGKREIYILSRKYLPGARKGEPPVFETGGGGREGEFIYRDAGR
jgi:hypothetical protein